MKYLHYDFDAAAGDTVEVTLDRAANVQLLDPGNFESYKRGNAFRYHGGYATTSPVNIPVPRTGHWHVIVDLGGGAGQVRAAVQVLSKAAT